MLACAYMPTLGELLMGELRRTEAEHPAEEERAALNPLALEHTGASAAAAQGRHRAPLASRWRLLTAAAVGAALASAAILVANAFLAPPAAPGAAEVQQGAPLAEVRLSAGGSCKASSSWRRLAHILGHLLRFPEPSLPRGRSSILLIRDKHSERCIQLPRGQKASQVGRKCGQFARCWFGRI